MHHHRVLVVSVFVLAACGSAGRGMRSAATARSAMVADTFVGKSRCSAQGHERPFVIEWDATDVSSFEARAKSDVVFVHYEGCELRVLERCTSADVRGAFGSYQPVEWTSGSVESLAIESEADLYTKLPLGVATLGGRVHGGEKLSMDYFVAGTRAATRERVYRGDLASQRACEGATHFVYGYNLGAFTLGAKTTAKGEAGAGVGGIGFGASRSSAQKADKTGGVIGSCRGKSAKEVETCKTPLRLTLRPIDETQNPDVTAMKAPETPSAKNLAGKLKAETQREKKAAEHLLQARQKLVSGDGRGCLADLDAHDSLDPRPGGVSTSATSYIAHMRSECLMRAGQCTAGKELARNATAKLLGIDATPEDLDARVEVLATQLCPQSELSPEVRLQRAADELNLGGRTAKGLAYCTARIKFLKDAFATIPRMDASTEMLNMTWLTVHSALGNSGPNCLARAGDCGAAWDLYTQSVDAYHRATYGTSYVVGGQRYEIPYVPEKRSFFRMVPLCRGKI